VNTAPTSLPSEVVQITALVLSFLGTVFTGIMAYMLQKLNQSQGRVAGKVADAAEKVEEVKTALIKSDGIAAEQMSQLLTTTQDTHTLVNSAHGRTLQLVVDLTGEKWNRTHTEADRREWEEAKLALSEHQAKERIVSDRKTERER